MVLQITGHRFKSDRVNQLARLGDISEALNFKRRKQMPYILKSKRHSLDFPELPEELVRPIFEEISENMKTPGELNYVLTSICLNYLKEGGVSYSNIEEVLGVVHGVYSEITRRLKDPYEDKKIVENGDLKLMEELECQV